MEPTKHKRVIFHSSFLVYLNFSDHLEAKINLSKTIYLHWLQWRANKRFLSKIFHLLLVRGISFSGCQYSSLSLETSSYWSCISPNEALYWKEQTSLLSHTTTLNYKRDVSTTLLCDRSDLLLIFSRMDWYSDLVFSAQVEGILYFCFTSLFTQLLLLALEKSIFREKKKETIFILYYLR